LRVDVERWGPEALHGRLASVDPDAAARLHPRDVLRVSRALEVALLTGGPAATAGPGAWSGVPIEASDPPYEVVAVGRTGARPTLYAMLDARVDQMLADGLLGEVRGLLEEGLDPMLPAMQGIGYRHLAPVVRGGAALGPAVDVMKRDTRRYAKR